MTNNTFFWLALMAAGIAMLLYGNVAAIMKHEYKWYYAAWTLLVFIILAAILFPAFLPDTPLFAPRFSKD